MIFSQADLVKNVIGLFEEALNYVLLLLLAKGSCGKVMFSEVCVCSQVGGYA